MENYPMAKQANNESPILNDSGCERSVLSAILNHGADLLIDIEEILDTKDFYWSINRTIFSIIKYLVHEKNLDKFDAPTIVSNAKIFNYNKFDDNSQESEYLEALFSNTPTYNNAKSIALQVYKLSLTRQAIECTNNITEDLKTINGSEKIDNIIGKLENPIFEFTSKLSSKDKGLSLIHNNIEERLKILAEDPKDIVGLPTGYPNYDNCIGGGYRRGTVNVIGARAKVGKCIGSFNTVLLSDIGLLMPCELFQDIKNIIKIDELKFNLLNEYGNLKNPEYWWNNGKCDVIYLNTKYGTKLYATPNHPIRTLNKNGRIEWVNMENLNIGDYVIHRRGDRIWGKNNIDKDDAYVLGLLTGDGYISNKAIDLSNVDDICRESFRKFIYKIGGDIGSEDKTHLRCHRVKIIKKFINDYQFYDEQKYKIIPKQIRMCDEKTICAFLSGYFDADGGIENGKIISATTNSEKLATQIKCILLNLGIFADICHQYKKVPNQSYRDIYWTIGIRSISDIIKFKELIGFKIPYKQKLLENIKRNSSTKNDVVPNIYLLLKSLKEKIKKDRGYVFKGHISSLRDIVNDWISRDRRARRDVVERFLNEIKEYSYLHEYKEIKALIDPHLLFEPIKKLGKTRMWTCDFYIPDGHSFVTNGIISHNSNVCLNIAKNMAQLNIPVLYLDTEMDMESQQNRLISLVTGVKLDNIETGKFSVTKEENEIVLSKIEEIKKLSITHINIAGQSIEASLSLARRWLIKNVGVSSNGLVNPCLIIYDYLKLMSAEGLKGNIQETQLLGFLITALHNFAVKWGLPILASVQLNRDGVEKEGAEVISGSDRILWLCSNFTILKKKSQEELIEDPPKNGNLKLVVTDTRYGAGHDKGDYINLHADFSRSKITEAKMLSQSTSAFLNEQIK